MQLFVAPVSYKVLILMFELFIGKTVPVAGPTAIVQISDVGGRCPLSGPGPV